MQQFSTGSNSKVVICVDNVIRQVDGLQIGDPIDLSVILDLDSYAPAIKERNVIDFVGRSP